MNLCQKIFQMKKFFIFAQFLLILCGCTYESTTIYYNRKEENINKFKTFAWISYTDSICKGDKVKEEAFHYINHSFIVKGYKMDTLAPDLLLDMQLLDENNMAIAKCIGHCPTTDYIMYFYPTNNYKFSLVNSSSYPYPPWQYELDSLVYEHKTKKRIITLHVIDRMKGQAVWSATALRNTNDNKTLSNMVHPIVRGLMKKIPTADSVD
jgi:hypothetical protein